jgi:hypothetical protein
MLNDAHGFFLPNGVDGPVTRIDVPGAPGTIAVGLSDTGVITGSYTNPDATGTGLSWAGDRLGLLAARLSKTA